MSTAWIFLACGACATILVLVGMFIQRIGWRFSIKEAFRRMRPEPTVPESPFNGTIEVAGDYFEAILPLRIVRITWRSVFEVIAFKRDFVATDFIYLLIKYECDGEANSVILHEEMRGFDFFCESMTDALPLDDKGWRMHFTFPTFGLTLSAFSFPAFDLKHAVIFTKQKKPRSGVNGSLPK